MTESSGHEDIGDQPLVRRAVSLKVQVILSVVLGVVVVLAAVWALGLALILLTGMTAQLEILWWAVFSGVVVYGVLAATVALRLWKRGVEGLRESGPNQN
jgi:hypothetical protein